MMRFKFSSVADAENFMSLAMNAGCILNWISNYVVKVDGTSAELAYARRLAKAFSPEEL